MIVYHCRGGSYLDGDTAYLPRLEQRHAVDIAVCASHSHRCQDEAYLCYLAVFLRHEVGIAGSAVLETYLITVRHIGT